MQLPIRLHDTKDAAETASKRRSYLPELGRGEMKYARRVNLLEKQATKPTREGDSLRAGDAITGVVLKPLGVDIESSKESHSISERHAMVDVS